MKTIFDLFETMSVPYYRQGTLKENSSMSTPFFTYWRYASPRDDYGDNKHHSKITQYYVYCYAHKDEELDELLNTFISTAEENNWLIETEGEDIPSNFYDYIGRMIRISYKENIK